VDGHNLNIVISFLQFVSNTHNIEIEIISRKRNELEKSGTNCGKEKCS
jgi:hypothetical protein